MSPLSRASTGFRSAPAVEPAFDVVGVEADEAAPFDVGDASFGDEPSHVADLHAETVGDLGDGEQGLAVRWLLVCAHALYTCAEKSENDSPREEIRKFSAHKRPLGIGLDLDDGLLGVW